MTMMSTALQPSLRARTLRTCGVWEGVNSSFGTFASSPWHLSLRLLQQLGKSVFLKSLLRSLMEAGQLWSTPSFGTSSALVLST